METLKMKIFMLKKENTDVSEKMEAAEKVRDSLMLTSKYILYYRTRLRQMLELLKLRRRSKNYQNRFTPGTIRDNS